MVDTMGNAEPSKLSEVCSLPPESQGARFYPTEGLSWYSVTVGTVAEFAVRAYCEDQARQKTIYWCGENPQIEIDPDSLPDSLFDDGVYAKPLDPIEELYHNALGDIFPSVKLISDYREIIMPDRAVRSTNQPSFFDLNGAGGKNRSKPRRITQ